MLVENSRPPGSMSLDPRNRPKPPKPPVPEWISSASSREVTLARGRACEGLPVSDDLDLQARADLCEQAVAVIGAISSRDLRSLVKVREQRDAIIVPDQYASPSSTHWKGPRPPRGERLGPAEIGRRFNQATRELDRAEREVEELAYTLAERAVKDPGDLRRAVSYLLSHPPVED